MGSPGTWTQEPRALRFVAVHSRYDRIQTADRDWRSERRDIYCRHALQADEGKSLNVSKKAPKEIKKILAVSPVSSYCGFNTSVHRVNALRQLDYEVEVIDSARLLSAMRHQRWFRKITYRLFRYGLPVPTYSGRLFHESIRTVAKEGSWDMLWLEKSLEVSSADIRAVREANPDIVVLGFSPDDMAGRHNQSVQFISSLKDYDIYLTTKTYNVPELKSLGAPQVRFVGNGFDPDAFRPEPANGDERSQLGSDIGFIGSWEEDRALHLLALAEEGFNVRVWGFNWESCNLNHPNLKLEYRPLLFDKFRKACDAFKINLNFLRKMNRDLQTTRSVEIPACGGFMLAERTEEHLGLFREGIEAEFFSSQEELVEKCNFYLAREDLRRRIAHAGRERCIRSGYSNAERLRAILSDLDLQPDQS